MLSLNYSNIRGEISFDEGQTVCKKNLDVNIEIGQLKMFFTEMTFLNKYAIKGVTVISIGAAPGFHTGKLADLFPDCMFELWDERDYDIKPRNNIIMNQELFTDKVAEKYSKEKKKYLIMCDMRDQKIAKAMKNTSSKEADVLVGEDMRMQMIWCQKIKPIASFMKLRFAYDGPITSYLGGDIYLQPYAPVSNEARLLTTNFDELVEYDQVQYDRKMSYHNAYNRCRKYKETTWISYLNTYNLNPVWDNIMALDILLEYVRKILAPSAANVKQREKSVVLFLEIVRFHRDKYWDKAQYGHNYNKIFGFRPSGAELDKISKLNRRMRRKM